MKDAIGTITAQQEMDRCFAGNSAFCALLTFDANQVPTQVALSKINLASVFTDGLDIEVAYSKRLDSIFKDVPGTISFRTLATNTMHYTTDPGIPGQPILETAGQNSGSTPHWRITADETYENDSFSFTVTERWFSAGKLIDQYIECTSNCPISTDIVPTINDNHMPGALYLDIGGTYNIYKGGDGRRLELYFKINNILDKDPTAAPQFGNLPIQNGTNPLLYDTLGRRFIVGVRFQL